MTGEIYPTDSTMALNSVSSRGRNQDCLICFCLIFLLFISLSSLTVLTAIAAAVASEEVILVISLSELLVELEQYCLSSILTGVLQLDSSASHTDSYPSIAISCIKLQQFNKLSSFTYEQLEIAFRKQGNWSGKSSCEAERRADAAITDGLNSNRLMSFCALKMISVARALRSCTNGGSLNLNNEMKKFTKEKGVMERIRHCRAPRINNSIRSIVSVSKTNPSSFWISETEYSVSFIFNAKQMQEIAMSFTAQGFVFIKGLVERNRSR